MSGPSPRPGILTIEPYVGGEGDGPVNPALGHPIRLASNEGAMGVSPQAAAAYQALSGALHRYPDGACAGLRHAIAERYGFDPERIVCGAGSDELIALLARSYAGPGDEVLYSAHGFLMYALSAQAVGATPVAAPETGLKTDVDALLARVSDRTRLVFIANPNNPTGSFLTRDEMQHLHAGLPDDVLLVVDAAYAEYIDQADYEPGADLVGRAGNVAMLRTFSKIYGLSALRLGWGCFPPAVADILNRVRGPFNVGAPAQAAGIAAIADAAFVEANRRHNETWRAWTVAQLQALNLTVHPSIANFLLVDFAAVPGGAGGVCTHLRSQGILVRRVGAYGLPDCLRVGIGTEPEMREVVSALSAYLR